MHPGSEIANMAVLGYDVEKVYDGRGVLEAASMGVALNDNDLAMRCNLICIDETGRIKNHSAGHIPTEESHRLISFLNEALGTQDHSFHPGVSYRHLFVMKNGFNLSIYKFFIFKIKRQYFFTDIYIFNIFICSITH